MSAKLKLLVSAVTKFAAGAVLIACLLFVPAGTLRYRGAWRLLALLFIPMLMLGAILFLKAPALLEKRLRSKEKESTQTAIVSASALMFIGVFVLAGLDFRFGLTHVPAWLTALASVLLLASYALYAEVMRENAYLSRTVEVQEGQKVIDTGLYGVVRHPMYTSSILLFLSMPLVLGSLISFTVMLIYPALIVARIRSEERLLREELAGYADYIRRVRWRLVPFIW